jgi:hypothetical protein
MRGAQKLRSEAHLHVRRNDEVAAQPRRWTFYETISLRFRFRRRGGIPINRLLFVLKPIPRANLDSYDFLRRIQYNFLIRLLSF